MFMQCGVMKYRQYLFTKLIYTASEHFLRSFHLQCRQEVETKMYQNRNITTLITKHLRCISKENKLIDLIKVL